MMEMLMKCDYCESPIAAIADGALLWYCIQGTDYWSVPHVVHHTCAKQSIQLHQTAVGESCQIPLVEALSAEMFMHIRDKMKERDFLGLIQKTTLCITSGAYDHDKAMV